MDKKGMAVVDLAILTSIKNVEFEFRSIMLLARELQAGEHVIDAGTLKTIEDLLFVARDNFLAVNVRVTDRLSQYRELAEAACDAVEDLRDEVAETSGDNVVPLFHAKEGHRQ